MDNLENMLLQTPDINRERLATLKELFPDLFTVEGKLNPDEFKKIIDPDLVRETERFEFRWYGKSEAKRSAFTPSRAALVCDKDRSVNPEFADGNMIIEGENLEVMKCLLAAYRERIKCIYIDPPYNTGKDFIYSDRWDESKEDYWEHIGVTDGGVKVDSNTETNGRFHSNWLNMMYSRLLIARQLMSDDGVIFISIDDNEVHHLRKLCDEVFGEENFVSTIIWEKRFTRNNDAKLMSSVIDYVVMFRKSASLDTVREARTEKSDSIYCNPDNDPRGPWTSVSYISQRTKEQRPNLSYSIINPTTKEKSEHHLNAWKYSRAQNIVHQNEGRLYWGIEGTNQYPRLKRFLSELNTGIVPINLWNYKETGTIDDGTKIVDSLIGKDVFDYPKPPSLIKRMMSMATCSDSSDIILDFFAGSGTTAHAVMELNHEDGGNRKFILIQIPELTDENSEAYKAGYKRISDITIERNKRVIKRIEAEDKGKQLELLDGDNTPFSAGFKVYKLAKSSFPRIGFAPDPTKTEAENVALLKQYIAEKEAIFLALTEEKDIIDEVLLKNGYMLNYTLSKQDAFKRNKVYLVKDEYKEGLLCLDMEIFMETVEEMKNHKERIFICLERGLDTTRKWNLKHILGKSLSHSDEGARLTGKYVFLDRDGVINVERGDYTTTIEQWRWASGAFEGIRLLHEAGFGVIVITNQACIAKGIQTEEGLAALHEFMIREIREQGGEILRVYHCPHQTSDGCACRKPAPGMILRAAADFSIDLPETFFIGDSLRDMEAGRRAGTRTILIDSGPGADSPRTQFERGEFRADDLLDAARIVIRSTK